MYLSGNSGFAMTVDEAKSYSTPWSQDKMDSWWGGYYPLPGPVVPASLIGRFPVILGPRQGGDGMNLTSSVRPSKLPMTFAQTKKLGARPPQGKEEERFFKVLTGFKNATRTQSAISKAAGAALQVVGAVFPVMGVFQAVESVGNAALSQNKLLDEVKASGEMNKLIEQKVIADDTAAAAQQKLDADARLKARLDALQTWSPTSNLLTTATPFAPQAASASAAHIRLPASKPESKKTLGLTPHEMLLAGVGVLLLAFAGSRT